MTDNKEDIKTDLIAIAKLNSIINYSDPGSISKACDIIAKNRPFRSVYGDRYHKRLQEMLRSEDYPHTCITCGRDTEGPAPMCAACEAAMLKGVQAGSKDTGKNVEQKPSDGAATPVPTQTIKDVAVGTIASAQSALQKIDKEKLKETARKEQGRIRGYLKELLSRVKSWWKEATRRQRIIALTLALLTLIVLFTLGIVRLIGICLLLFAAKGIPTIVHEIRQRNTAKLRTRSMILSVYVPLFAAILFLFLIPSPGNVTMSGASSKTSSKSEEDIDGLIGVDANALTKNLVQTGSGYVLDIDESEKITIHNAEEATELILKLYPEKDGWSWTQKPHDARGFVGQYWAPIGKNNKYADKAAEDRINELAASGKGAESTAFAKRYYQTETHYTGLLFNTVTKASGYIVVNPYGRIMRSAFPSEPVYRMVDGDGTVLFRVR